MTKTNATFVGKPCKIYDCDLVKRNSGWLSVCYRQALSLMWVTRTIDLWNTYVLKTNARAVECLSRNEKRILAMWNVGFIRLLLLPYYYSLSSAFLDFAFANVSGWYLKWQANALKSAIPLINHLSAWTFIKRVALMDLHRKYSYVHILIQICKF